MSDDDTIESLRRALATAREGRRQPDLLRAYAALAAGYLRAGRLSEAESAWRTAVQQARIAAGPLDLGRALLGLARTLAQTPRTDRALLHYTEATMHLRGHDDEALAAATAEMATLRRVPGGAR